MAWVSSPSIVTDVSIEEILREIRLLRQEVLNLAFALGQQNRIYEVPSTAAPATPEQKLDAVEELSQLARYSRQRVMPLRSCPACARMFKPAQHHQQRCSECRKNNVPIPGRRRDGSLPGKNPRS